MCRICGCGDSGGQSGKFVPIKNMSFSPVMSSFEYHHREDSVEKSRLIQMEVDLLSKNNVYATKNRHYFQEHGVFVLNLVSSPGRKNHFAG